MTATTLLGLATLLMVVFMTGIFLVSQRIRNAGIVDIAWSFGFTPVAILYAVLGGGDITRRVLIASMVALWSLRLTVHLYRRVMGEHPTEDGRYVELREKWGPDPSAHFLLFFQAQALLVVVLSTPALAASLDHRSGFGALEWAGLALWMLALGGEALADRQLSRFKADPAQRGRTCQVGLWRYSRHPNYFFEWLVWCGFATFAAASPFGWVTVYCPLLMLYFLFRVTGIPATEAHAVRSRGEEYRAYQRTTSPFFPWFRCAAPEPDESGGSDVDR